ncbi:MAG TPA: TIR domain-containing protein [Caulobacteraceae bacterium]|jgi:hypothetical protein|nr:TIR domain-containing protein [Caulobacteraceae bacterium]
MSASIFISYASQDQKVATTLCKALEGRNFKCWIAARDIAPGENFQIAIVRAIRAAKIMLLVFTGNSNNSDEMAKELALASQSKLIVVPLLIDDVRPNDAFSYEFATRQWIDFFSDWETAIEQLAQRIAVALATETGAAPAAAAPPEPPTAQAPTPDVIMQALAAQPAEVAAPIAQTPAVQTLVDPAGQTAVMAAAPYVAPPQPMAAASAYDAAGPSSFQDPAPAKRGAPIGLIVALSLLVVVAIAAAAVVLPSFLAPKPAPPPVATATPPTAPIIAPANTATALTTTQSPAPVTPTPPLVTQPTATTPGPAPLASDVPPAVPTGPPRLRHLAPAADAPEDPDLDPETHPARGRHRGGESPDVPY